MDYHKILRAYIEHVIAEEGCDFMDSGVCSDLREHLSEVEFTELENVAKEARGC